MIHPTVDIHTYLKPGVRVHLAGIGGVSMCPLAEVLRGMGLTVQGSDMSESDTVRHLRSLGIDVAIDHCQRASETAADSPVVAALRRAVTDIYQVEARPVGIGGATVAALLRRQGLPAAVWSCIDSTCHQPDEHSSITATLKDAQVFAHVLMQR